MQPITVIYPYYCQPNMFAKQIAHLRSLDRSIKDRLEVIFVDDGSPINPLIPEWIHNLSMRYFRTDKDVEWNWPFCRNLGASKAKHDWILFSDLDHVCPERTLAMLMTGEYNPSEIYYFQRIWANSPTIPRNPHWNSHFMHRSLREKIGGNDERLCGYYAMNEGDFLFRSREQAKWIQLMQELVVTTHDLISDARCHLFRDKESGKQHYEEVMKWRAENPGWRPLNLTFPCHELHPDGNQV